MICRWESLWCIILHDPMCVWLSAFFFSYNLFLSNLRCTWKFWNVWLLVSVALPIAMASEVFWVCHVFLHENTAGDVYTSRPWVHSLWLYFWIIATEAVTPFFSLTTLLFNHCFLPFKFIFDLKMMIVTYKLINVLVLVCSCFILHSIPLHTERFADDV